MEAALRWLADQIPGTAELLRLMDGTPIPCGQSVVTAKRSNISGYAGYGYCASHRRFYWGAKLMLIVTCDGTVTGFALANPNSPGNAREPRSCSPPSPLTGRGPGPRSWRDLGCGPAGHAGKELRVSCSACLPGGTPM